MKVVPIPPCPPTPQALRVEREQFPNSRKLVRSSGISTIFSTICNYGISIVFSTIGTLSNRSRCRMGNCRCCTYWSNVFSHRYTVMTGPASTPGAVTNVRGADSTERGGSNSITSTNSENATWQPGAVPKLSESSSACGRLVLGQGAKVLSGSTQGINPRHHGS